MVERVTSTCIYWIASPIYPRKPEAAERISPFSCIPQPTHIWKNYHEPQDWPGMYGLDDTFGATLIGIMLAAFAHGICTIQVYRYWNTYRQDSRFIRLYVLVLWLLDTFKGICIYHAQYSYTVTYYGNLQAMLSTTCFLALRTWNFARRMRPAQIPPIAIRALGLAIVRIPMAFSDYNRFCLFGSKGNTITHTTHFWGGGNHNGMEGKIFSSGGAIPMDGHRMARVGSCL
ncbi:unnamed protein product [Rhizoctonia solani]|uniref:Uncharacterized protein n=1 Tax=Rhizoctonia solani TaxID=456999 RepID=A0A8H3GQP4_9AGAM|nr:unnamed protein product [Rhizoctonia solani]